MEVAPQPQKILYVITKSAWGGAQRYVYDLATAARAEGNEVLVVTGNDGPLTEKLDAAGVATHSITAMTRDVGLRKEVAALRALVAIMRNFRPDVVHANSSKAGGLAAYAAHLTNVPRTVFTAHGWAFNEDRPWWQKVVIYLFHYLTVFLTDQTICVSRAIRNDARLMPFVKHKLTVVINGADPMPLLPKEQARARLASGRTETLWIGSIAELHPTKNLVAAVEAFARIKDEFPNALLVIMGEGQDRVRLEQRIETLHLRERVRLVGHVTDAASYLSALDVFILPSRSEALGYALIEAGHAGLPVIASRVGGIPEIVRPGVDGVLVAPTDVLGMAHAMRELFSNESMRRSMGASLKQRVAKEFTKVQMAEATLALYR